MERFVYLNGNFFDRVSNTAEEMARSLGAKTEKVVPRHSVAVGDREDVFLVKEVSSLGGIRSRLMSDSITKARLKEAMEHVSMNGTGYVSLTDAVSLANWLIEVYHLPSDYFTGTYTKEPKALGEEIQRGLIRGKDA